MLQSRAIAVACRVLAASLLARPLMGYEASSESTATKARNHDPTPAERRKLDAGGTTRDEDSGCNAVVLRPVANTWLNHDDNAAYGNRKRLTVNGRNPRLALLEFNLSALAVEDVTALSGGSSLRL